MSNETAFGIKTPTINKQPTIIIRDSYSEMNKNIVYDSTITKYRKKFNIEIDKIVFDEETGLWKIQKVND